MTVDTELVAMMNAVFADHRAVHGPIAGPELWDQLRTLGLARLTGAEESGGSGAGWREAAELTAAAVRSGVRIGLPEHDLLACWLLEDAGIPAPAEGEAEKVARDYLVEVSGKRFDVKVIGAPPAYE